MASARGQRHDEQTSGSLEKEEYLRIFAPYVKHLELDFRFLKIENGDQRIRSENVAYTMAFLIQEAKNVEELEHFGLLSQEYLEQIIKIPLLKTLRIRKVREDGRCPRDQDLGPVESLDIAWWRWCHMSSLTMLEISSLFTVEVYELAKAVRSIPSLESIPLVVAAITSPEEPFNNYEAESPIIDFLYRLYDDEGDFENFSTGFPSGLKILALIDCHH